MGLCAREALELDADGQAALQLCQHVARLALVEGAGADEEDVVRAHIAVLGAHLAALNDGQQIALHTLATCVCTCYSVQGMLDLRSSECIWQRQKCSTYNAPPSRAAGPILLGFCILGKREVLASP